MSNNIQNKTKNDSIKGVIEEFRKKYINNNNNTHRYASYDFCYGYFYKNKDKPNFFINNMEMSCMILWSYLASWGMLRGSSKLLQKSPAYLTTLVNYINEDNNKYLWDIDVDKYKDNDNINKLHRAYTDIKEKLGEVEPSKTLITKIMLGVYGNVPAFDTYFTNTFKKIFPGYGFSNKDLKEKQLQGISNFYKDKQKIIDNCEFKVLSFNGDVIKDCYYTKAKIIDMYGFTNGLLKAKNDKETKNNK